MGYQDGHAVQAQFYVRELGPWVRGDLIDRAFLAPLAADGLLDRCRFVATNLEDPVPVASAAEILERSHRWSYDVVELMSSTDQVQSDLYIHLSIDPDGLRMLVGVGGEVLGEYRDRLLELARRWMTAWNGGAPPLRLAMGSFDPIAIDYPRPEALPKRARYVYGSVQQYAGVEWHDSRPETAELLKRFREAPLPPFASRAVAGDTLILPFIDDLSDIAAIARARGAHAAWLVRLTNPEL